MPNTVNISPPSFGLPPGPLPFNGQAWDNPVRYPLNRGYGDEFSYPTGVTGFNRRWKNRGFSAFTTNVDFSPGSAMLTHFDAQGAAIYTTAPAGDFEILLQYSLGSPATNVMVGPLIVDTAGAGYGCSPYNDANAYLWRLSGWAYSATGPSIVGAGTALANKLVIFALLRRVGTTYSCRFSANGSTFLGPSTGDTTVSFTPAYIGVGRFLSADGGAVTLHRFNVFPAASYFVP